MSRLLCCLRRRSRRRKEEEDKGEANPSRPPSEASPSVDDGTMFRRQHRLLCCLWRRTRRITSKEEGEADPARPPSEASPSVDDGTMSKMLPQEEEEEGEKGEANPSRPPSEASPSVDDGTMSKMLPQEEEEEEEEEDRSNPHSEAPPSMDGMLRGDIRQEGALLTADTTAVKERSPDNSSVGSLCSLSSLKEAPEKAKKFDLQEKEQQDDWSLESILGDSWASDLGSEQLQMPETPSSGLSEENPDNDILQQILQELQDVRSQLENQKHLHDSQMSILRFEWKEQKEQQMRSEREQQKEKDGRKQLKTMVQSLQRDFRDLKNDQEELKASETAARLKIAELERQTQKLEVENGTLLTKCHLLEGRVAIVERQLHNLLEATTAKRQLQVKHQRHHKETTERWKEVIREVETDEEEVLKEKDKLLKKREGIWKPLEKEQKEYKTTGDSSEIKCEGWSTDAFLKRKFPVPEESNSQSRRDPTQRGGLKKAPERHMEKIQRSSTGVGIEELGAESIRNQRRSRANEDEHPARWRRPPDHRPRPH